MISAPVLKCVIGIDILNNWQNPHIGSMTCGVRASFDGKEQVEATRMPLPIAIVSQELYHILAEISAILNNLKETGVVISNKYPSNSPTYLTCTEKR